MKELRHELRNKHDEVEKLSKVLTRKFMINHLVITREIKAYLL